MLNLVTSCLLKAAQRGSLVLARALLSNPLCDLVARDEEGNTALHIAASSGHHDIVQELASRYTTLSAGKNKEGHTPLHLACSRGWAMCVTVLANRFPGDLKEKDEHGNLPLHLAALFGHGDIIDCLCDRFGGDPESTGCGGCNCLHLACCGGHVQLVHILLVKYNCRRDAVDNAGLLPTHCAAFYGHADILKMLMDKFDFSPTATRPTDGSSVLHHACAGAHMRTVSILKNQYQVDPNFRDSRGQSALHFSCVHLTSCVDSIGDFHYSDDIDSCYVVGMLINMRCDPMAKSKRGHNALHYAAISGQDQLVKLLAIKYGCPVNCQDSDGNLPLHLAASKGHSNVLKVLLSELGADNQTHNKQNESALNVAALNGHSNVVSCLVQEFGCSPHTKGFNNRTPLHQACDGGHLELVEELIDDYHCDPMARDEVGLTPLHVAAFKGKEQVVRQLVTKYKCPVDCVNSEGETPLHCAAGEGHAYVVQVLLSELGANVQTRNKQNDTALNVAALCGHSNVVTYLVEQFGCSPHTKGFNNRTLLHHACFHGSLELVEKLIDDYHCDLMARDDNGLTPLHIAAGMGREQVVRQLVLKHRSAPDMCEDSGNTVIHTATSRGHKDVLELLIDVIGCFPSVKNNQGKSPIDCLAREQLSSPPMVQSCVSYVSKHAVGVYRQAPPKILVFDRSIALAISEYSLYSLFPLNYSQSCGICHVNSELSDIHICQIESESALQASLLQRVMTSPLLIAICTVNMEIPINQAMSRVHSQISLVQELAYQNDCIKVPSQIILLGTSSCGKENIFNAVCASIVERFGKNSIRFSKCFLACDRKVFPKRVLPIITKFLIEAVSTVPNPDISKITHGSIYLLKFLFREYGRWNYVKFSQLEIQLEKRHIMAKGHPENILARLKQLDSQGYLLTTGSSDYQNMYIILNPLHVLTELDEVSHTMSDPLAVMGIFSQRVLSSVFPNTDFSLIHSLLNKLSLCLELLGLEVNIFLKGDASPHASDRLFFIPHLVSLQQKKCWISQPKKSFLVVCV